MQTEKDCPKCLRSLPLSDFGARTNGKVQHWCRGCHCRYQREYYQRHKDYYLELQNTRIEKNRHGIRKAKRVPCKDCKKRFPYYVMDFDHRPDELKCFNLANVAGSARLSWEKMEAEIKKCDVVCANCHRKRTHKRKLKKLRAKRELLL